MGLWFKGETSQPIADLFSVFQGGFSGVSLFHQYKPILWLWYTVIKILSLIGWSHLHLHTDEASMTWIIDFFKVEALAPKSRFTIFTVKYVLLCHRAISCCWVYLHLLQYPLQSAAWATSSQPLPFLCLDNETIYGPCQPLKREKGSRAWNAVNEDSCWYPQWPFELKLNKHSEWQKSRRISPPIGSVIGPDQVTSFASKRTRCLFRRILPLHRESVDFTMRWPGPAFRLTCASAFECWKAWREHSSVRCKGWYSLQTEQLEEQLESRQKDSKADDIPIICHLN